MVACLSRAPGSSIAIVLVSAATLVACSSGSSNNNTQTSAVMCSSPGQATAGAADTHCAGMPAQTVSEASCHTATDGGADGGTGDDQGCPYGATMFGHQGDDDDCKYRVSWTSTSICEGFPGVTFNVTVLSNTDGSPVTDIPASEGIIFEAFIPTDPNAACDNVSNHPTPSTTLSLFETSATSGVYSGNIVFDKAGDWTVRFHIHEECDDILDDSPHGHAAFRITVP